MRGAMREAPGSANPQPAGSRWMASRGALMLSALLLLLVPTIASACPVCYGQPGTPITDGARNGILFLLGVIGSVQIGFIALFVSFWKKAKAVQEKREQFKLIQGGAEE